MRRSFCLSLLVSSTAFALGCGAAAESEDVDDPGSTRATEQAVAANIGLPDWNWDGVIDGTDAVSYLEYYGITFDTHRLTDDANHTGVGLPRRPWDWAVKTISEGCLASEYGADAQPFPPEEIPGIVTFAENMTRMPQQFLREIARKKYRIMPYGHIGRLAKRWSVTLHQTEGQLMFYRTSSGYVGKLCTDFDSGGTCVNGWETLQNVSFTPWSGKVTFRRQTGGQNYEGNVNGASDALSIGTSIGGTFSTDAKPAATYAWSGTPIYQTGGTTAVGGLGSGSTSACDVTAETVGRTGGVILIGVAALSGWNGVHEIAHAIETMIHDNGSVPLYDSDSAAYPGVFPGGMACVKSGACALEGSGYYSRYGASNEDEDFAEVYTALVLDPGNLQSRIDEDDALGSDALEAKRAFIADRVDLPDPAPAAAVHPADGLTYRFATRHSPRWSTPGTSPQVLSASHVGVTVASNSSDRLWMFRVSTNGNTYAQPITSGGSFGSAISLGQLGRVPVAATLRKAGEMIVVWPDAEGDVRYRLMNATTGALGASGTLEGLQTNQPLAVAAYGGVTYVFGLSAGGDVFYTHLDASLSEPGWISLGKKAHGVSAVTATPPGKSTAVYLMVVDKDLLIEHRAITAPTKMGAWQYEQGYSTVFTAPAMSSKGEVYLKGFDGNIYTRLLDSGAGATLVAGL